MTSRSYNDRHGHEAGNDLLKGIARPSVRPAATSDRVYRYGGDEFCLILPQADAGRSRRGGRARALGRLRGARRSGRTARGHALLGRRGGLPCDAADRAELLLAADRALYAAKRSGRDRVGTAADGLALAAEFVPPPTPVDQVEPAPAS